MSIYYASPTGGGSGTSDASPFLVSQFKFVAAPGAELRLLSGRYTGASSMLIPTIGQSGTSGSPITVRAIHDGEVIFDGEGARIPFFLSANSYWRFYGFNCRRSSGGVVQVFSGSHHNEFYRIIARDAADANHMCWDVADSDFNYFEECAGFGTARKAWQFYQSNDNTRVRCFGMYNKSTHDFGFETPMMASSLAYNSFRNKDIDGIYTADADSGAGSATAVLYSAAGADFMPDVDDRSELEYIGTAVFVRSTQSGNLATGTDLIAGMYIGQGLNNVLLRHCAIFVDHAGVKTVSLNDYSGSDGAQDQVAENLTEVGPGGEDHGGGWTISNSEKAATVGALSHNIWDTAGTTGARLCKMRDANGDLTVTGRWPWPMNQRLIDELTAAGRTAIDVTATMEAIWGTIPAICRTSGTVSPPGGIVGTPGSATPLPPRAFLQGVKGDYPLLLIKSYLDTDTEYTSDIAVAHPSWSYQPRLLALGAITRSVAIPPGYPSIGTGDIEIADSPDPVTGVQHWRDNLHTTTQRNREIEIKIGFAGGRESLFEVPYRGKYNRASYPPDKVRIEFGDIWRKALARPIPMLGSLENFPNAPAPFNFPLVFGKCLIPLVLANALTNDYAANQTISNAIEYVERKTAFDQPWTLVPPSEYSMEIIPRTFYGITYNNTFVRFNAPQDEGVQLRCYLDGTSFRGQFGTLATRTGTIQNIVDHVINLSNLMFRLNPVSLPFDFASWHVAWQHVENLILHHDGYINTPMTFGAALGQMCGSSMLFVYQNNYAEIAARIIFASDPNRPVFTEAHDILRFSGVKGSSSEIQIISADPPETVNTFNFKYARNAEDKYEKEETYVNAPDLAELGEVEEQSYALPFVFEAPTARWVIEQVALYHTLRSYHVEYSVGAPGNAALTDLTRSVGITYYGGIGGHWINKEFIIYSITFNPQDLRYHIKAVHRPLPAAPVSSGGIVEGVWARNSRVGPFFEATLGQLFYVMKKDASSPRLGAYRSQNFDAFAEVDVSTFTALANEIGSFDVHRVGNLLHVATQERVTGRVAYHEFNMATSTWAVFNEQIVASTSHGDFGVSITVNDPSGEVVVWYQCDREERTGSIFPAATADGFFLRTAFRERLAAGSWTPETVVGNPNLAAASMITLDYNGKVQDIVGRVIAGKSDRLHFLWGRTEPADVASTPDFWIQTRNADGSLGAAFEFQPTVGLDYSAAHLVGDYATFAHDGDFWLAAPILFGGFPCVYLWRDADGLTTFAHKVSVSSAQTLQHVLVAGTPAFGVKWLNGQLHMLFSTGTGAATNVAVLKTLTPPFASTDVSPSWTLDPLGNRAGPTWPALTLQMVGSEIVTIGGTVWLFSLYATGTFSPTIFEAIPETDLPVSASYTGAQWLIDHP